MALYRWYCSWESLAVSWDDSQACLASSKVMWRNKKKAEKAANRHESSCNHRGFTIVQKVDGRKFKGFKIID